MKEVLISIKPEWCELIMSGKKTIEFRKSGPKNKEPFKAIIYCSKGGKKIYQNGHLLNGKVIGEFNSVAHDLGVPRKFSEGVVEYLEEAGCASYMQMLVYAEPKSLYIWKIEDLLIHTTPKELSEFGITRAPQSWQYIKGKNI